MQKSPEWYRRVYQDISGALVATASTDDSALVTCRGTAWTVFLQHLTIAVTTQANTFWSFEGTGGTPILFVTATNPAVGTVYDIDFGAEGVPLDAGDSFLLDVAATGIAGSIAWEGYQKQTGVIAHDAATQ